MPASSPADQSARRSATSTRPASTASACAGRPGARATSETIRRLQDQATVAPGQADQQAQRLVIRSGSVMRGRPGAVGLRRYRWPVRGSRAANRAWRPRGAPRSRGRRARRRAVAAEEAAGGRIAEPQPDAEQVDRDLAREGDRAPRRGPARRSADGAMPKADSTSVSTKSGIASVSARQRPLWLLASPRITHLTMSSNAPPAVRE